ncbi:MAG: hypothetical protein LUG44_03700 [Clostridiales bacterium]|nr:hypothetical protein [Clostridiales bacterium]
MKRNKNMNRRTSPNDWEKDPFDNPAQFAFDRVLSLLALAVGAAALALHTGPAVVGLGLLAMAMGVAGLVCGTW